MKKLTNFSLLLINFSFNLLLFGWHYFKNGLIFFIIVGLTLVIIIASDINFHQSSIKQLKSDRSIYIIRSQRQKEKIINQLNRLIPKSQTILHLRNELSSKTSRFD